MESSNGRNHVDIEIAPAYEAIVTSLKQHMEKISCSGCICKVSEDIGGENRRAYIPENISIGPLHRDMKKMEDHKWRYLYALLNRRPNLEASLESCVRAIKELEGTARLCYAELDHIKSDDFVQLMLVDGGFIIELFLKYSTKGLKRRGDPIFTTPGLLFALRWDMILLENQIPFFILQRLFQIVPLPKQCNQTLTELAFRFFRNMIPGNHQFHREKFSQEANHLLDMIRYCFLPTIQRISVKKDGHRSLPSATTLQEDHGIKLKRARTENLLDIKFANGVLEIPPLHVHHYTESLLRNLIAFELLCPCDNTHHITSYVILMRSLIHSEKDVKLFKRRAILTSIEDEFEDESEDHNLNKVDMLYKLFESLPKIEGYGLKDFYFDGLCEEVNGYKAPSWFVWLVKKKKNAPFPFTMITVVGLLLLVFTFVGTLFSVISFFFHH